MNTKEICKKLSVTTKMLRVYEEGGLIHPQRGENNYRDYSDDDVLKIQLIVMLRNLGFSVKDIDKIFREKEDHLDSVLYAFYFQLQAIELQRKQLEENRRNITEAINQMLAGDSPVDQVLLQSERPSIYDEVRSRSNFDDMAEDYVERFLKEDTEYHAGIGEARRFLDGMDRGTKILDAGGGTCYLWKELPDFTDVTILDNSLPMLMYARQNFPAGKRVLKDVLDPVSEEERHSYDVVISTFLFHHMPYDQQRIALQNLIDVKKHYGILYIVERFCVDEEEIERSRGRSIDYKPLIQEFLDMVEEIGCQAEVVRVGQLVRCLRITEKRV